MDPGVAQLAEVIAAHLAAWDTPPYVELAIYGTSDARAIASELDVFCRRELHGAVARGLFYQSSVGSVTAVELVDGRRVVVKAHQPDRELAWLQEIVRVQMHLASRGLYATTVCGGPAPIGRGLAIVEALFERGATRDGHDPAVRAAMANGLYQIIEAGRGLVSDSALRAHWLFDPPPDRLWPAPHAKAFDFEVPADWIDDLARAARARMIPAGKLVIGHGDWKAEHVRFEGDRIVGAFDWDSLCKGREPALVGYTAMTFAYDWSRTPQPAFATLEESRALVAEYEAARGRAFTVDERRLCGAAYAYACAYLARCGDGLDHRAEPGSYQHFVASHGPALMEL
jgi:hypothetical protein